MFSSASVAQEEAPVSEPRKRPVQTVQPRNVAKSALFPGEFIVENVMAVHRRAAAMAAVARYELANGHQHGKSGPAKRHRIRHALKSTP